MTLYDALGIDKDATIDAVKRAFRGKAKKCHPDAGGSPDQFIWIGEGEDKKEYPKFTVEISSKSHPCYTGEDRTLDKAGRVERFKQRASKKK